MIGSLLCHKAHHVALSILSLTTRRAYLEHLPVSTAKVFSMQKYKSTRLTFVSQETAVVTLVAFTSIYSLANVQ